MQISLGKAGGQSATELRERDSSLLKDAITAARGRNEKAIRALLNVDALKASKDQTADIRAALEALKKDSGYLFETDETPPPYAAGTGTSPAGGGMTGLDAIRAAAGLATDKK